MKKGDLVLKANMWDLNKNPIGFGHDIYKISEINGNVVCLFDYPNMNGFYDVNIKDIKLYES